MSAQPEPLHVLPEPEPPAERYRFDLRDLCFLYEPDLTLAEWEEAGEIISRAARAMPLLIGDWVNAGQGRYEHGRYEKALRATGLAQGTLANYASVAARVPPERRHEFLSYGHYASVADLEPDEQASLLSIAVGQRLTVNDFRERLRARSDEPYDFGDYDYRCPRCGWGWWGPGRPRWYFPEPGEPGHDPDMDPIKFQFIKPAPPRNHPWQLP